MNLKLILLITCLMAASIAYGANNASDFLSKSAGARALGMGSAYVAVAQGADSIYLNPAGISFETKKWAIASNYSTLFNDVKLFNVNTSMPFLNGILGLSYGGQQVSDIPFVRQVNERPDVVYYFNNLKRGATLTYAFKPFDQLGIGVNVKNYNQLIDTANSTGVGYDFGFKYELGNLAVGFTWQNIGGTVLNWSTGHQDTIPALYTVGLAMQQTILDHELTIAVDADLIANRQAYWHYGLEYWLAQDLLAMRVGLDQTRLTLGVGLSYAGFKLDYAFMDNKDLGESQKVSVGVAW